jgi:hypothetical protein
MVDQIMCSVSQRLVPAVLSLASLASGQQYDPRERIPEPNKAVLLSEQLTRRLLKNHVVPA